MKGMIAMTQKTSKDRKELRIVLTVIVSAVLLCVLITGGTAIYLATPHTRHFTSVTMVSNKKTGGKYLYQANSNGQISILRSDKDLAAVLENNGENIYEFKEQDIRVKATGIEIYRTDISGIFAAYPVISYEYAPG